MIKELQTRYETEKRQYKYAIQNKRYWIRRKTQCKALKIYDKERTRIESNIAMWERNVSFHRLNALKLNKKIHMMKVLTGGSVSNNETNNNNNNNSIEIKKFPLDIGNDYQEANRILESGEITSGFDSVFFYCDRVENDFVWTYRIKIERRESYENFISALVNDALLYKVNIDFSISFEEWKSGYIVDGKRKIKINKFLRKKGFSQYILDLYSQQIRTEKNLYLTVSDRVQHIAGMSYYSTGEWDGMSGSSCQDPRNEYEECIRLLGSLHDDKLLVIFLHESLEDLDDMNEKMLARTIGRIVHVDGFQFLIGTRLYGNNETKDLLENCLRQLNGYGIFSCDQMSEGDYKHRERANGCAQIEGHEEIHICEYVDEYAEVECPLCGGAGTYTVYDSNDNGHEITCPACHGEGSIETNVYIDINEYVDVETTEDILPYAEEYLHYGGYIEIYLDRKVLGLE